MEGKQESLASFADTIRHDVAVDVLDRHLHASDVAVRRGIAVESVKAIVEEEVTDRKLRKEGAVTMPKRNTLGKKRGKRGPYRKKIQKRSGWKKHSWTPNDLMYVAKTWPDYEKIMKKFGITKLAVKCAVGRLRDKGLTELKTLSNYGPDGVLDPYDWVAKEVKRRKLRVGGKSYSRRTRNSG